LMSCWKLDSSLENISGAFHDHLYELKNPKMNSTGSKALKNKNHPQNVTVGVHFVFPKYGSQTAQRNETGIFEISNFPPGW